MAGSPVVMSTSGAVTLSGTAIEGFLVATGTPTISLYDGLSTSGKNLLNGLVCVPGTYYTFPATVQKGLYVSMSGSGSITFFS
jgi:hypothetical protein